MEKTDKTPEEQVSEHRRMVAMTGNLSDFQLKNLKTWPFIVLGDHITECKVEYDFTKYNKSEDEELCAGWVIYNFVSDKKIDLPAKELKYKLEQLSLWTKFLFWEDTQVKFEKNGKKWEI